MAPLGSTEAWICIGLDARIVVQIRGYAARNARGGISAVGRFRFLWDVPFGVTLPSLKRLANFNRRRIKAVQRSATKRCSTARTYV